MQTYEFTNSPSSFTSSLPLDYPFTYSLPALKNGDVLKVSIGVPGSTTNGVDLSTKLKLKLFKASLTDTPVELSLTCTNPKTLCETSDKTIFVADDYILQVEIIDKTFINTYLEQLHLYAVKNA